ncbi:hypothetical protein MMYC01_207549 [Madurella mycetomatis]|uniref:Uncharacterized protein n=1 Tax=Madurella mycetomatis TaxID=100816 RepID=A0A175VYM5_9PEZI|nr:hypothetical protein MMYC01_209474 [Madurella mycetomatis]KXX76375.1 hypothetical protein MMYC01_207549 [Madurella mycetomatis]
MWPTTTNLKISQNVGPSSPPQTPRTASPVFGRKSSPPPGVLPPQIPLRPMAPPPLSTGRMAVNGPNFSHPRAIHPDQLSPRTTSASSPSSSDAEDSDDSDAAGPAPSGIPERRSEPAPPVPQQARAGRIVTQAEFIVEELTDFDDSDDERPGVVRPCAIEYAESDRSRSRSRNRPEIDQRMMFNLGNLNCCDNDSDETDMDEIEYREFLIKQRAEKRRKRMTSGSIGKRTISESIGSDTDREDLKAFLGADEVGSSARRLRRKVGDRRSLQFQDPPPPRIEELDEPDSSEDEILIGETLARELPYYEYVAMEVDSP